MSLLLVLFYFIGIPALVIAAAVWLWRRSESSIARGLVVTATTGTLFGLLWLLAGGPTWSVDDQVRELCAKDGGLRVYETVTLSAERFDKWGNVNIPNKRYAKPTDEYYFESVDQYVQRGNPKILKMTTRMVRSSDGKILGESVRYARSGGDLPGPWHGTSFGCPKLPMNLESSIFLKGNEE